MAREMLDFAKLLRIQGGAMSLPQLGLFAISCCERQYPVYVKAVGGNSWGDPKLLRDMLDAAWKYFETNDLVQGSELNAELCADSTHDDPAEANEIIAADVAYSISNFLTFLTSQNPEYVYGVSETSFNMLDGLIYAIFDCEIKSANDKRIDEHELVKKELDRQKSDLNLINKNISWQNKLDILKSRNVGCSVFGDSWYPENY